MAALKIVVPEMLGGASWWNTLAAWSAKPPMADSRKPFVERLFAHRGALQAFFYRHLRAKSGAADLVREVYLPLLRVTDTDAIRNPEAYL